MFPDLTVEELDVSNLMKVGGLTVYGNYLYWVDTKSGRLSRVNKMTGQGEQLIQGDIKEASDVLVVDKHSFDGMFICYRLAALPRCIQSLNSQPIKVSIFLNSPSLAASEVPRATIVDKTVNKIG